jgi:hypothetical protein
MEETVKLIIAQIKMLEHTYNFAVGETGLYEDGKDEILKALNSFKNKVEQEGTLDELSIYYDEKAGRIVKPK